MSRGSAPLVAFNRVGDRSRLAGDRLQPAALRPALFGAFGNPARLRGDFPLMLTTATTAEEPTNESWVLSLSDLFDRLLREQTRPGAADEEKRRVLLALEAGIREIADGGQDGDLGELWQRAARALLDTSGPHRGRLQAHLDGAREAVTFSGPVTRYDGDLGWRVVQSAWRESQGRKAARLFDRVQRLARRLNDILDGDFLRSRAARDADRLSRALGSRDQAVFDFAAMARVLKSAPAAEPMPEQRRRRIQSAIDTLLGQGFVTANGLPDDEGGAGHSYEFEDCAQALQAFRNRLPEMCALIRAIGIAELEIDNHYDEAVHDAFFRELDENRLGSEDLGLFPSLLVRVTAHDAAGRTAVLAALQTGLPLKLVVEAGDVLGPAGLVDGKLALGRRAQDLSRMATGLDDVFVLQSPVASLYRLRRFVMRGVTVSEPTLFHLFTGANQLISAAAGDSRVFPSLLHDPSAGPRQRDRFQLPANTQPRNDWPEFDFESEGPHHDRRKQTLAFTAVDFMAADTRFADAFAAVPEHADDAAGDNTWVPLAEYLQLTGRSRERAVPYIFVLDPDNRLYRAVVEERLVDAAIRCRAAWHALQELAGINNSHAEASVKAARSEWQQQARPANLPASQAAAAQATVPAPAVAAPAATAVAMPEPEEPESEPSSDDPWIETLRCTTCNECTQINARMFAYNADKRAYIADPDAGTYRELVQAAETCQVAIIHPGKPRNPDEPGLEDLMKRAEPFL